MTTPIDISPEAVLKVRNYNAMSGRHETADLLMALRTALTASESLLRDLGPLLEGCDCTGSDNDADPCPCARRRAILEGKA